MNRMKYLLNLLLFFVLFCLCLCVDAQSNTNWLGVYAPSGGCTPAPTCCCGIGIMLIESGGTSNTVKMSGQTDGGQGCYFQKSLNATLTMVNATTATYSMITPIALSAAVTRSSSGSIAITSDRTTCANTYTYKNALPPSTAPPISAAGPTSTPTFAVTMAPTTPPVSNPNPGGSIPTSYPSTPPMVWNQQLVLLGADSTTPTNTQQFSIVMALPVSTAVTYVILHYRTSTDTIQMNVLMSAVPLTSNDGNAPSYRYYSYQPVAVGNGQTLIYSFSYADPNQRVYTSPFYYYSQPANGTPTTVAPTISPTQAPVVGQNQPLSPTQKLFIGTWEFDSSACTPSVSCCCAQNRMIITSANTSTLVTPLPDLSNLGSTTSTSMALIPVSQSRLRVSDYSSAIALDVQLDGSPSACLSQNRIVTIFDIDSQDDASLHYDGLIFTANITESKQLIFKNTMYTCPSQAKKISDDVMKNDVAVIPTSQPISGNFGSFSGRYRPDGTCIPSQTCCCPDPNYITSVEVSNNAPLVAVIQTKFVGVLLSCYQLDGSPRTLIFSITSPSTARASILNVTFDATFTADRSHVRINNTAHPTCPSTLIRVDSTDENGASISIMMSQWNVSVYVVCCWWCCLLLLFVS